MRSIFQEDEYGCGVACIAMLCRITYKSAKSICGEAYVPGDGIEQGPMLKILEEQGFRVLTKGRITQKSPVTNLARPSLLWAQQLPSQGRIVRFKNVQNHWAIWDADAGVVRDPYRYRKPLWLTKFFELEALS